MAPISKKQINFQQQIQNSQQFLKKLQTIKKTSNDIKQKNKLTQHRNFWCKQYKYLSRLQRDMDLQLTNYLDIFDRYFQVEIDERRDVLFGNNSNNNERDKVYNSNNKDNINNSSSYRTYSQLRQYLQQNLSIFEAETYRHVQSLPLLLQKVSSFNKTQKKQVKKVQILQILNDIHKVLENVQKENKQMQQKLIKSNNSESTNMNRKNKRSSSIMITNGQQNQQLQKYQQQQEQHQQQQEQQQNQINTGYEQQPDMMMIATTQLQQQQQVFDSLITLKNMLPKSKIRGFDMEKQTVNKLKQSQTNLLEYLQLFNTKLSQDQIYQVLNEFNHANRLLQQTFELEKQKLQLDYEQQLSISNELIQKSQSFNKISHIYATYIGRGKSIQLYNQRLSIQFPKVHKKQLETVTQYIQARIYKQKKLNSLKRNHYKQKQQLFNKVDKQIHLRIQKNIERQKKRAQLLQRKEQKLRLQKQLQILREDYNKRKEQKQQQQRQHEKLLKQQQRKKQAIRRLYLDELTKKAQQVSIIKTKKQLQQERLLKQKRQKQQQQKKLLLKQNKPKVQLRQSIQRKKIQKKVQQRQLKQKLPEIQAQRIKNAIESYNFRPKVEFDNERLNKPTQAMIKKKQTFMDMADKVELSKMTGYSVNQLMSDMRFKVNMALQQAGLSGTNYARELLVGMSKKPNNTNN